MQRRRRSSVTLLRFALAVLFSMSFAVTAIGASAQDSTPVAEDMGHCTTALGIGAEGDACINVLHLSPDAPAVDVYLNGEAALTDVPFGAFSGWIAIPAGEHQVLVVPTGEMTDAAVIDTMLTVESEGAYHIAATGVVAEITAQVYQANLSEIDDEMARIRVIHTSPDAPSVDIAVAGGDVLIEELPFPEASAYLEVPAGSYDLEVRPATTMDVALDLPGVELEAGMVYDVFAIGQAGDGTLDVLILPSTTVAPEATPAS